MLDSTTAKAEQQGGNNGGKKQEPVKENGLDEPQTSPDQPQNAPPEPQSQSSRRRKRHLLEGSTEQPGRILKRFRLVTDAVTFLNGGGPFILIPTDKEAAEGSEEEMANFDADDDAEHETKVEHVEYRIRPVMGTAFSVTVPITGCLFDLYDAVYVAARIPWDRQVLSVGGQVLPGGDKEMLAAGSLPKERLVDLSVRMASGMETAPLNPELLIEDYLEFDDCDDEDDEDDNQEETGGRIESSDASSSSSDQVEVLFIVEETSEQLQSLSITTPMTGIPPPPVVDNRLTGPASCAHCRRRCRPALQFTCRCNRIYCHLHRYHDQHACTVDIAQLDRAGLARANPRVVGDRL